MGKRWGAAFAIIVWLLLASSPVFAQRSPMLPHFVVKPDRDGRATGFYLLEYLSNREILMRRALLLLRLRQLGRLAIGRRMVLVPGYDYVIVADCRDRPVLLQSYPQIPSTTREFRLQCPLR